MEEVTLRSWGNPIIKESYEWMLKIGRELKERLVLVGGWATYLQAQKLGSRALPSLDIDFVALKEEFNTVEKHLLASNFIPVSFRYVKYYHETLDGRLKGISFEESKKIPPYELRELFLDVLWDEKISSISFAHPYARVIFEREIYEEIKGINVAFPEVILSMKFLIENNKYRGEKQLKDLIDIYVLTLSPEELDFDVFKLLYSKEKFSLDWVIQYFKENEEFLASVMRGIGITFDREEFLLTINELKESLKR
ncbi:hypothetical protein APY94_01890 [Thermococcus celericrescens]|uniref:Uncharacterized protein n=1 Tax=Thermococcus celericrescens TaxID=227598 RepID=A0A100XZ76_9EURY|nr:hypothetical protein [Thermococcus celericrescens]KUH34408.1 hypothetical protein APY94_01890 [Thermococcus celericrescens]